MIINRICKYNINSFIFNKKSTIHMACKSGDFETVRLILNHDETLLETEDEYRWKPVYYICYYNHKELFKYIIKNYNPDLSNIMYYIYNIEIFRIYKKYMNYSISININCRNSELIKHIIN